MKVVIVDKKGKIQTVADLSVGAEIEVIEDGYEIEINNEKLFQEIKVHPEEFTYDLKKKNS
jgi:hypothetical protein